MSLFFDVLSAINNPAQQGSVSHLEAITSSIQQAGASQGIDPSKLKPILSATGGLLGPLLKQQQGTSSSNQLGLLIGQISGAGASAVALQSLFPAPVQQQLIQGIAQKTGVSPNILQGMLPTLLPAVMELLNMGASKPGMMGGNPLLTAFLSGDGNTDLGEVFHFANRFLNPPQS